MNPIHQNSPTHISSPSIIQAEKLALDEVSSAYRVNRNNTAKKVKRQKIFTIAKLQMLLIFIAIIIYAISFPVKYLIANSDQNKSIAHCKKTQIKFNGWSFRSVCNQCQLNFQLNHHSMICVESNILHS